MKDKKELISLKGIEFPASAFKFKKLGDFLYHEGPLLSHFVNDKNDDFLAKWCDTDAEHHRWLIFKTSHLLLQAFFDRKINLHDMVFQSPGEQVYFADIAAKAVWKRIFLVDKQDIPTEYLPLENSYFGETRFEEYALRLKTYLDVHFARQQKVYETIEPEAAHVMEPPSDIAYQKKK